MEIKYEKTRLFVTTGLISLINCLTIIRQTVKKDYIDTLLIFYNSSNSKSFVNDHNNILKIHNFKEIYYDPEISGINNPLKTHYDEIICVNHSLLTENFINLYQNSNFYLTEEGIGSYFKFGNFYNEKIKKIYLHEYYNKIKFINLPKKIKSEKISLNIFKEICKEFISNDGEKNYFRSDNGKKRILITGQQFLNKILKDRNDIIEYYSRIIEKLLELDFEIFYKSHPREDLSMANELKSKYNKNIVFFESYLPIELYNIDFTAIFSPISGTTITMNYIWGIPSFCDYFENIYATNFFSIKEYASCQLIINKFIPNIFCIFEYIKKNTSHKEAKRVLVNLTTKNISYQIRTDKDFQIKQKYYFDTEEFLMDKDKMIVNILSSLHFQKNKRKLSRIKLKEKIIRNKINKYSFKTIENNMTKYPSFNF